MSELCLMSFYREDNYEINNESHHLVMAKIDQNWKFSPLNCWQLWIKRPTKPTDGCSNRIIRYHKANLRFDYVPYNYNKTNAICAPLRDNTSSPNFLICCVAVRLAFSSLNKWFSLFISKYSFHLHIFLQNFHHLFYPSFPASDLCHFLQTFIFISNAAVKHLYSFKRFWASEIVARAPGRSGFRPTFILFEKKKKSIQKNFGFMLVLCLIVFCV